MALTLSFNDNGAIKFLDHGETAFNELPDTCREGAQYCQLFNTTDNFAFQVTKDYGTTNLVTTGDFSSSTGWTLGANWSIGSGVATAATSSGTLSYDGILTNGKDYRVYFSIAITSGSLLLSIGGTNAISVNASGRYCFIRTASGSDIDFIGTSMVGTLDDVVVQDVDDFVYNDLSLMPNGVMNDSTGWTLDTNVTISAGKLDFAAATNNYAVTPYRDGQTAWYNVGENGKVLTKTYKIVFTVSSYSAGAVIPVIGLVNGIWYGYGNRANANGTYTDYLTAVNDNPYSANENGAYFIAFQGEGATLKVDDVKIYELAGDHYYVINQDDNRAFPIPLANVDRISDSKTNVSFRWDQINLLPFDLVLNSLDGFSGTNWSWSAGAYLHTTGSTVALTIASTYGHLVNGETYTIEYTVAGRTTGSIRPTMGTTFGTSNSANGVYSESIVCGSTNGLLTFVPSSLFDGSISSIKIYLSITENTNYKIGAFTYNLTPDPELSIPLATANATSTSAGKLVDSGATFITDGVIIGMVVKNVTDGTFTTVTNVASETSLDLNNDIFVSGETYQVWWYWASPSQSFSVNGGQLIQGAAGSFGTYGITMTSGRYYLQSATSSGGSVGTLDIKLGASGEETVYSWGGAENTKIFVVGKAPSASTYTHFTASADYQHALDSFFLYEGYVSECICVGDHDCTTLLSWTNDNDAYGFEYYPTSEEGIADAGVTNGMSAFIQYMRVLVAEGGLRRGKYVNDEELHVDSSGIVNLVHSESYKTQELYVDEQPEYIHDSLRLGILHDDLTIDAVRFVHVEENYTPEWENVNQRPISRVLLTFRKGTENNENTY